MFWHIDTDIVALLVMCALYYYTVKLLPGDEYTARNKSFVWCLRAGIIMTVIDIAASIIMDVPVSRLLYQLCMTAYILSQDLVMVLWLMYALTILYDGNDRSRRRVTGAAWALYAVYGLLALSNPWSELFFSLGPDMEYVRGPLFLPGLVGLNYVFIAALLVLLVIRRKFIPVGYPQPVLFMQPVILSVAVFVQLTNPGWLLVYPAYMLCLVLAFLFFQNVRVRNERAQLQQLAEIVKHFACGMAIFHITWEHTLDIRYISKGMAAICETDAAILESRLRQDILWGIHPDDRGLLKADFERTIEQRQGYEQTYRFVTGAGKQKWINVHVEVVEHGDGMATVYATYTDLTRLRKAEQLLDVALLNTKVSIWEYDFARRCIIQYQNSTEMHGFEQVVANVPQSLVESGFVHPDSAAAFLEMYDKLFAGASFAEGVFKVQTSDRKGYWFEHIRYTNEFDENGQPYRAVGISTDETERQEAIAKYERELEKIRGFMAEEGLLAHATFNLTTCVTLDYRYQDGSEVPEQERTVFTYAPAQAGLLIDEEERERFLELNNPETLLAYFAAGKIEFRQEYRRRLPDGRVAWVRNILCLLQDPHSGDVLLFDYLYDIETEKMQELMYRSIATDNYDFVAYINGRSGSFKVLIKEGLTYHLPPCSGDDADVVTRTMYNEGVLPEDRELAIENSLLANVQKQLREHGRFVFTYRLLYPDGSLRYKKITQYYIDVQREIIVMLREDITDVIRQETEKNLVLSEALAAANQASQAKSQFLSRVSHELRTPLNAIIGFMELAKDADSSDITQYLANSDAAAKQLLAIINDVLDVSSIESGKLKIAHAPFDFKRLIKNISDLFTVQCCQKGLSYETMLLTEVDEWLLGDQLRVNQILLNLLNNALKFTESGRVWLSISQRQTSNNKVIMRFEVSDTGCGISEDMQNRLFTPFEQESTTTAQRYGGNGLGLSIVGSLVSMMNGVVSVRSHLGKGSSFTVDIPFSRSEMELEMETIEGAEKLHVLAVDDQPGERDYMSAVMKRLGVRHLCVSDSKCALAELKRSVREGDDYNVCLVDWKMPDINGLETTRHIRELYGTGMTIIVVSAYDHYQADESARAAGANMFISKPLFQSALFDLFATMTNGRIVRRQRAPGDYNLQEMRILLVEDNIMNQIVAKNLVTKKFKCRCECAQNGKIAVDMFLASPQGYYDAILMDIQMPVMDGYEATRQIRASLHPDAASMQIIALTANAFSEDVTKSLSSGMNAHVSKPIEPDVLGAALVQAFVEKREACI